MPKKQTGKLKRRFETRYFAFRGTTPERRGYASSVGGALRATVFRVFIRQHGAGTYAIIHDRELDADLVRISYNGGRLDAKFLDEDEKWTK